MLIDKTIVRRAMAARLRLGKSQSAFWRMFGLSQPAASRFECERRGSPALLVLLQLYLAGRICEADLTGITQAQAAPSGGDQVQLHGPGNGQPS
jgi:transcriptional regulator with XRE-family HTH domain